MKKMFVTGMNMNKPKAYIEPNMKVIEVDVECLQTATSNGEVIVDPTESDNSDDQIFGSSVKLFNYNVWDR